ncbi:nucleotide-binding domain-containing protein [Lactarius hengduanensis]|nr:nucleotide-binding domain-containing protein [Lactarius hengduanensis]
MSQTHVVILGAGVIGLTIAHVLTEDAGFKVTIVARDMPEDLTSQGFASPWAGADWSPLTSDDRLLGWEKHTFDKFWSMIPTGLARGLPFRIYSEAENVDSLKASQWKGIVRNFRVLPSDYPLPPKAKSGVQFDTYSVNPDVYLPWLKSQLEGRGVSFVRRLVSSLDEAGELAGEGGVIINATSLGARSLLGVEDTKVFPIRGQVVLVYAPNVNDCVSIFPEDTPEVTYVIPRASTPGMVLIGGTAQPNNWDTSLSIPTARGILARAKEAGGPRVEAQFVELPSEDALVPTLSKASEKTGKIRSTLVVHAYGFGPAGYQQSWGAAEEAVRLLKENSPK